MKSNSIGTPSNKKIEYKIEYLKRSNKIWFAIIILSLNGSQSKKMKNRCSEVMFSNPNRIRFLFDATAVFNASESAKTQSGMQWLFKLLHNTRNIRLIRSEVDA